MYPNRCPSIARVKNGKSRKISKKSRKIVSIAKSQRYFSSLFFRFSQKEAPHSTHVCHTFHTDLLEKVLESAKDDKNETDSIPADGDGARRRKSAASPSRKPQSTEPDYTPEQLQHVKRIQRYGSQELTLVFTITYSKCVCF